MVAILSKLSFFIILGLLLWFFLSLPSNAAASINPKINFQGRLVGTDGTNVTNGNYSVVFSLYNVDSGGANIWTETQTVAVANGIFQVDLGASTAFPSNLDWNNDTLYLGIKVGSDAEMTPRIRFDAVPYAFNSEKVNGLTVTSTTGTLTIPNTKTISFADSFTTSGANALTLTTVGTTNVTLPTGGTLLTTTVSANQTITSTQSSGTVFSVVDSTTLTAAAVGQSISLTGTGAFDQTGLKITLSGATGSNLNALIVNDGTNNTAVLSKSGDLTLGVVSTSAGSLILANTSANTVAVKSSSSTSGSYTLTLPIDDGNSGEVLRTDGSGVLSWVAPGVCGVCVVTNPSTTAINTIAPTTNSVVALTVKGTTGTAANVLEIFDSTATPARQAYFDNTGTLNLSKAIVAPTSTDTINGAVISSGSINGANLTLSTGGGAANQHQYW
jgi:hypothetical protein